MIRRLLLGVSFLLFLPSANAALIGSGTVVAGFGWYGAPVPVSVNVGFGGAQGGLYLGGGTFDLGSPDYTQSFVAGPDFEMLAKLLTNGQDDELGWSMFSYWAGGTSSGVSESYYFAGSPAMHNGIDFAGSIVDRVDFSIINHIASPGSDPNHNGAWTDFNFDLRMDVYGTTPVPEPDTVLLMFAGLAGLSLAQRLRNR